MKRISYGIIQNNSGLVVSRLDDNGLKAVIYPVMDYDAIGVDGNYTKPIKYYLVKDDISPLTILVEYTQSLKWTRKIPIKIKNQHRVLYGMKPLKETYDENVR